MKKMFLLAAAALVAFASCSKNDVEKAEEAKAIGFNSYAGRTVTKADASLIDKGKTALNDGSSFVVYAYNTGSANWSGSVSTVFMDAVDVTYAGGGPSTPSNYSYSPKRYWPNDEAANKLSFFAYYPKGGVTAPTKGWGDYSFTAEEDPADMVDFLVSKVAADYTYTNSASKSGVAGAVKMEFYHTLTMVKFLVKTSNTDANTKVTLTGITLAGVEKEAKLTPSNTSSTWSVPTTEGTFVPFPTGTQLLDGTAVTVPTGTPEDDAYLMIPQTLDDAVVATITYTVQTGTDAAVTNTATVKLNTGSVTKWEPNKNIEYTFIVGLRPIEFIATVTDWDGPTGVDFNVF